MRSFNVKRQKGFKTFLRTLICGGIGLLSTHCALASLIVIGSSALKANQLSKTEIASVFLGKTNSVSGQGVQPYNQPDNSPMYTRFYKTIMGWDAGQVNSYWSSMVFSGEASQPPAIQNDKQAIYMVKHSNNAVAYIDSRSLKAKSSRIKVLYGDYTPPEAANNNGQGDGHFVSGSYGGDLHSSGALVNAANMNQQHQAQFHAQLNQVQKEQTAAMQQAPASTQSEANASQALWPQIISHFSITEPNNAQVRHQVLWYLAHRSTLTTMLNNARPYIAYVYEQTQARHMPAEFALLPFVESGYDPFAYSHAGASGLWQMMPGTASSYGLNISWWYDGRRDITSSTKAALNYLVRLHSSLNSWDLAAASYDAGYGAVSAAMAYNRRTGRAQDFWALPLPNETRDYVPKLLALADIIKHHQRYHIALPNIPDTPYFSPVTIHQQLDKQEIAQLASISVATVTSLNPGMQRWATSPDGTYQLLLPRDKVATFENHLHAQAGKKHISWQYHLVGHGETLAKIAHNYHTSIATLRKFNGLSAGNVVAGQGILVPLYLNHTYHALPARAKPAPVAPKMPAFSTEKSVISTIPAAPHVLDVRGLNANDLLSGKKPTVSLPPVVAGASQRAPATAFVPAKTEPQGKPITQKDSLKSLVSKLYSH